MSAQRSERLKEIHRCSEGLAGAALDTHYHYPMAPDHPLWKFPEVIMIPHFSVSSGSPNYLRRVWEIIRHNLRRLGDGQPLLNELNPQQILRLYAE